MALKEKYLFPVYICSKAHMIIVNVITIKLE